MPHIFNIRLLLLFSMLLPLICFGQRKLNLSLFAGFSNYSGELQAKRFTINQAHAAFGAGLRLQLKPKWHLHGTLRIGKLSGDDKQSKNAFNRARNLNFYSNLYEAALIAEYSFLDMEQSRWTPYVSAGAAIFRFNPHGEGFRELRQYSTEGQGFFDGREPYRIITIAVPAGAGIRYRISETVQLGYEISFRKTFTDYIDDVSTTYVDADILRLYRGDNAVEVAFRGDEIDRTATYPAGGTLRGSPKTKDWYYFSGITLSFAITNADGKLFGKKLRNGSIDCFKF